MNTHSSQAKPEDPSHGVEPGRSGNPSESPEGDDRSRAPIRVVGVGASAGGLEALKTLFASVPEQPGLCFVVVVHLSPEHKSHLADLLQPSSRLPIQQVTGTTSLEPNHVYVIPPRMNLEAIDTHLWLSDMEPQRQNRAPIDHFFRTLAEAHHERAVGVVLTGMGVDGTLGLKRIRECGGLTIVQSPDEAEYDAMPRNAIAAGAADLVYPVAQIPAEILHVQRAGLPLAASEEGPEPETEIDGTLRKILALVQSHTGHDFTHYKRSTILRRIHRRMQLHRVQDLDAYLEVLHNQEQEVGLLFEDFLVSVTEFFRDPDVFAHLETQVIPQLFESKAANDHVRVWSVGCATGEEAYSLAMLLLEEEARREGKPQVQVFATDLHEAALRKAREGRYPASIEADVSPRRLNHFFLQKNGGYRVRKQVRERIVFAQHNVLQHPPFMRLQLVSCRNLLIYLRRDVQHQLISLFHYALEEDGWLLVGRAEGIESDLFVCEDKQRGLYRRRNIPTHKPNPSNFPLTSAYQAPEATPQTVPSANYGALHEQIVEQYAPPSALLNSDGELVHYSARAARFLQMPGGTPTHDIFQLLPEPLRLELRAAVQSVRNQATGYRSRPIRLSLDSQRPCQLVLRVQPIDQPHMRGFLVIFDELEETNATPSEAGESLADANVRELEVELEHTKKRMQALIEEHEAFQERTQAYNEEMESTNEELRSTMEDLEASKAEVQSMNEELTTLNQEYRQKVEELHELSGDLHNLLTATHIATVFLDRQMRIRRFTPSMAELFGIRDSDRGRLLTDLTRFSYEQLQEDFQRVIDQLTPIEREVRCHEGRWYVVRLQCYVTDDDHIEGVVITFIDITERKEAQQALERSHDELERQVAERTARLHRLVRELNYAEQRERKRMASVLHDELQQLLVSVKIRVDNTRNQLQQGTAREPLDQAVQQLDEAIDTTHTLVRQVFPQVLYEQGLILALRSLSEEMANRHGLKVRINAGESEPRLDEETRTLLFESVRETLFNVVKHAAVNEAAVDIHHHRDRLEITVSDEGIGLDVGTTAAEHTPSGFGIFSLSDRIESLGGHCSIDSARGQGTRVRIEIPLAAPLPHESADQSAEPGMATSSPTPPEAAEGLARVVVVDDHALVREGIVDVLSREARITVVGQAGDGEEALTAVEEHRPDIVLMDIKMPRLNGIEATREIRRRRPDTVVIGLSVEHQQGDAVRAISEAGAAAFLSKSADAAQMVQTILHAAGS